MRETLLADCDTTMPMRLDILPSNRAAASPPASACCFVPPRPASFSPCWSARGLTGVRTAAVAAWIARKSGAPTAPWPFSASAPPTPPSPRTATSSTAASRPISKAASSRPRRERDPDPHRRNPRQVAAPAASASASARTFCWTGPTSSTGTNAASVGELTVRAGVSR